MKNKVLKNQYVSRDCFVCGIYNNAGLQAKFYEMETQEVVGIFTPRDCHQSYPNRLHGGVSASMVDEVMGRSIMTIEPDCWSVTVELETQYKKPVPLNEPLRVIGKVISNTKRVFEAEARILLADGEVAVTAHGKYVKLPVERIVNELGQTGKTMDDLLLADESETPSYIEY